MENFCVSKRAINKVKRQPTGSKHISDKSLASTIYKELLKLNNKKMKRWTKDLNRHFFKNIKGMQMTSKHTERCTDHYPLGKCK